MTDRTGGRTEPPGAGVETDAAFAEFFAATWPRMFRTAVAIVGDAAAAEDCLQSAYARAYASWRRVSSADHPEAYVRRMVVNEIMSTRRHGWWRRERPSATVEPAGAVPSPEADIVRHGVVWAAVQELPVRQRAVVVLRYYEDLSEQEIAATLGCSRGTVKSQASAALANLRRYGALRDGAEA